MRALPLLLLVACDAVTPRMLDSEGTAETGPIPGTTGWVETFGEPLPEPPLDSCPAISTCCAPASTTWPDAVFFYMGLHGIFDTDGSVAASFNAMAPTCETCAQLQSVCLTGGHSAEMCGWAERECNCLAVLFGE
jgi:hypothetical protein